MVKTLTYELVAVNVPILDTDLREVIGAKYLGLSFAGPHLRVMLADVTDALAAQVDRVIAAHDPTELTEEQQVEVARLAAIAGLKAVPVASWTKEQQDLALRLLWEVVFK